MPTAGEARLTIKKNLNERSAQIKTRNSRALTKRLGKENLKPPCVLKKNQPLKAKPAPDFSKVHEKWENKFHKGKAVAKRTNTKVDPFVLTTVKSHNALFSKNSDLSDNENNVEDFGFKIDNNALQGILNNTGIQQETPFQNRNTSRETQKSVPNPMMAISTKRTSIYYTGTKKHSTTQQQPLQTTGWYNKRPAFGFQAKLGKKQIVWANQDDEDDEDDEDEEISFKPDASALESILNNKGIDERQTLTARATMASTRSLPLQNYKRQSVIENQQSKRTSIYYMGPKCTKGVRSNVARPSPIGKARISAIEQVPSKQWAAVTASLKQEYVPGSTVVGRQDDNTERKDFEVETFVKPSTLSVQETSSQICKITETRPFMGSTMMTPSRNKPHIKPQAPAGTTTSTRKEVTWSDILTPHRGMDHVKSVTKSALSSTDAHSTVAASTIALKLFDENAQKYSQGNQKEKLELEELEKQAIDELQLLELEENQLKKSFDNDRKTTKSIDISGCEPLLSPLEYACTPRRLKRRDDEILLATPINHMRITVRKKNPVASQSVRNQRDFGGATGILDPRCHQAPIASSHLSVSQFNIQSDSQALVCYTTPRSSPCVRYTGQGASGDVCSVVRSTPFTPKQNLIKNQLDIRQSTLGLPSSIKKSPANVGSKRPHFSSVATSFVASSNPPQHKSLSWTDSACNSTPSFDVGSSFLGHSTATNDKKPTNACLFKSNFLNNGCQPVNKQMKDRHAAGKPMTTIYSNEYGDCRISGKEPVMSLHSPALVPKQAKSCSITESLDSNLASACESSGVFSVACEIQSKLKLNVDFPRSLRVVTSTSESLSLRSAVGKLGFQRRDENRIMHKVPTVHVSDSRCNSSQMNTLAEEALLDTEVALCSSLGVRIKKRCIRDLSNPLATIFDKGDSQHIVPICLCSENIYCSVHPVFPNDICLTGQVWGTVAIDGSTPTMGGLP